MWRSGWCPGACVSTGLRSRPYTRRGTGCSVSTASKLTSGCACDNRRSQALQCSAAAVDRGVQLCKYELCRRTGSGICFCR